MNIEQAKFTDSERKIVEATIDSKTFYIPIDSDGFYSKVLRKWVKKGNTIADNTVTPVTDFKINAPIPRKRFLAMMQAMGEKIGMTPKEVNAMWAATKK